MTAHRPRSFPALVAVALAALLAPIAAVASGLTQLAAFLEGAKNGRAAFVQTVGAKAGGSARTATGTFTFARPGKFRWAYEKPFEQLIVGDGERLWIFDRDLNQVIVRRLDRALGSSPAAILAGDNALEKNFVLADDGEGDGLEFVVARPRGGESGFDSVRIGLLNLGFEQDSLDHFNKIIRRPNGIFLVTGPTGSGKTTTLYSALDVLNTPDRKIITA